MPDDGRPLEDHAPSADPAVRLLTASSLLILAGLAWSWTVAMTGMPDCDRPPLPAFMVMWTVMMAAMMFPAIVPVVLVFVGFGRSRRTPVAPAATAFVAGYLVVWGLLGLPARGLIDAAEALGAALPALARLAVPAGGIVLVACGLFQLTPLKDACLQHCRVPHLFLGHHWRDGIVGAFRMGAHHGLYCAGCCASLMVVLLVVGVMNLGWMVGLSALIYLEKVLPGGQAAGRVAGVALCGAGLVRLLA